MRLDHLLSKEHTRRASGDCPGGTGVFTSGTVDALTVVADATGPSTAVRALVVRFGVERLWWWSRTVAGLLPVGGWLGGTLLGPEESGAAHGRCGGCCFLVVVWLLDSGREHLCSCLLRSNSPVSFCEGGVLTCFCCVCVCGDKL